MLTKCAIFASALVLSLATAPTVSGAAASTVESRVSDLEAQNRQLKAQVDAQQQLISQLSARLDELAGRGGGGSAAPAVSAPASTGEIRISGEAGVGYFDSQLNGTNPNREFRVDDAKLFVDSRIWKDVFLFAGMELSTREAPDENFHLGELYVDFEGVAPIDANEHALNIRAGRFYVPFGEEYQLRGVMDNPLITHSVSDLWGIDEGVEVYGTIGKIDYVAAVQNGGIHTLRDFDQDKSLAGRISFSPVSWLRLSGSAMRTGRIAAASNADFLTAEWFGGGFFRAIAPPALVSTFGARLYEADAVARWSTGSLLLTGGQALFDSNAGAAFSRRMRYYGIEASQNLLDRLYLAARYSRVQAPNGYALAGLGNMGTYFFGNSTTDDLHRLSVGLGYRFAAPLVWKAEYSRERGRMTNGQAREKEDMISSELGVRF